MQVKALGKERLTYGLKEPCAVVWDSKSHKAKRFWKTPGYISEELLQSKRHPLNTTSGMQYLPGNCLRRAARLHETARQHGLLVQRTSAHCFYCWGGFILIFPVANCTSTESGKAQRLFLQAKQGTGFCCCTLFISGEYYIHLAWANPTVLVLVITKQGTPRTCSPSFPERLECTEHHAEAQSQAKHPSLETKTLQVNSCSPVPMLPVAD